MPDQVDAPVIPSGLLNGVVQGLFLDVPYVLDSMWRRAEFYSSRVGRYIPEGEGRFEPKPLSATPLALQLGLVILFFCYGPTFESLCTAFGQSAVSGLRMAAGVAAFVAALVLSWKLVTGSMQRVAERRSEFLRVSQADATAAPVRLRFAAARFSLIFGAVLFALPFVFLGGYEFTPWTDPHSCDVMPFTWAARAQFFVFIAGLVTGWWILRQEEWRAHRQIWAIAALFAILALVLWVLIVPVWATPPSLAAYPLIEKMRNATEANGAPYVHVFAVFALALTVLVLVAQALAWWCVSRVTPQLLQVFRSKILSTELLQDDRPDPRLTHTRLISAFVNGITYNPLHFLLLAAFGALFSSTKWLWASTTAFAVVAVFLIMWGSLSSRWEQFMQLIDRWFLSGTPLVVSLAAIAVGVLRLMDVQYVSTILDAAPFGTLFVTLVMAYTGLWLMEYWINRWLGERLLWVLGAPRPRTGWWSYGPPLSEKDGGVAMRGQVLSLHGTGRFAVHGWFWRRDEAADKSVRDIAFITFGYIELFDLLAKVSDPDCANNIRRRVRLYFNAVNLLLLVMLFGFVSLRDTWNKPLAQDNVVSAIRDATPEKPFDLAAEIVQKARNGRDSLIVAASGGGTRAALYTVTALEGLARLDRTRDIVLLSGVSGGGVAAAYFANRFDQFQRDAGKDVAAWNDFRVAMGEPFIQDVLDGASEWRIQSTTPLGTLLAESFERRLFAGPKRTLGDLSGVGLILNTTVSGHPRQDSVMLKERIGSLRKESCLEQSRPFSSLAGGRLVFTNLSDVSWQPKPYIDLADVRFDYTFVRDGRVPLAAAAALNANFPPVFPNARVRIAPPATAPKDECPVSYFVTDGGATENLGLLSALYALRTAIPHVTEMLKPGEKFPEIHLVAIEASAVTYDYSQDRGIGAATGGSKERIAGGLTQELMRSIYAELPPEAASAIHIHYLPLPLAFRSRGGYGTHWMSARTVRVSNPLIPEPRGRIEAWWRERLGQPHYEALDECQVTRLWSQLYRPDQPFCSQGSSKDASLDRVSQWICGNDDALGIHAEADWQVGEWGRVVEQLGSGLTMVSGVAEACP